MKKHFIALIGLALLGASPVLGQTPVAVPNVVPGPVVVGAPAVPCPPDCCACPATRIACVPEPYVKKTPKPVYSCGSEPICLCYFHGLFRGCGCQSGECAKPYTAHYLIKKIRICEEDAIKCVPVEVPACEHGR
jgi:hypothetical protein